MLLRMALCACAWACSFALAGCWQPTPFGVDPDEHDLNARAVAELSEYDSNAPRFVAIGDTHRAYDELAQAMRGVAGQPEIDFVAYVGDASDLGLQQELEWTQEALAQAGKPTLVAIGNHDALSSGRDVYREMYGATDFSFEWAGVKWIFFNSNTLEFAGVVPSFGWLRQQLATRPAGQPTVLFTHRPPLGAEDRDGRQERAYRELFAEHPITLFVNGHSRQFRYARLGATAMLQCSSFNHTESYAQVTLGRELRIERCVHGRCARVVPEPDPESQ